MGFTELAIKQQKLLNDKYPTLIPFYQEKLGNFKFTKEELLENLEVVMLFMENDITYKLIYQLGYFYLTDFID